MADSAALDSLLSQKEKNGYFWLVSHFGIWKKNKLSKKSETSTKKVMYQNWYNLVWSPKALKWNYEIATKTPNIFQRSNKLQNNLL